MVLDFQDTHLLYFLDDHGQNSDNEENNTGICTSFIAQNYSRNSMLQLDINTKSIVTILLFPNISEK